MARTSGITTPITVQDVATWIGFPTSGLPRLRELEAVIGEPEAFELPRGQAAHALLAHLEFPAHTIDEIVESLPTRERNPEAWWLLERLYSALVDRGPSRFPPPWLAPVPGDDLVTRYFHLYVFLAGVPHVLELHAERGIDPDVTWATMTDLGLQVANYQHRMGKTGFDGAIWMWEHFRGEVFRLGRLQYNFGTEDGERVLEVHIPALGPLDPAECDASFAHAKSFFATHFPELEFRHATCTSWLLDDQLQPYLGGNSNIVKFQDRFTLTPGGTPGNDDVLLFVFGYLPATLDELPQTSSVQRAVVEHIRAGKTWLIRHGYLEL